MEKSYIWTLPTRVFHFLLIILITFMFFSDDDSLLLYHVMSGYLLLILFLFRFVWGFIGPKYSHFKFFYFGKTHVKLFLEHLIKPKQSYYGHNPLASYVMMAILIIGALCIISGIITYGSEEHKGLLSSFDITIAKEFHEWFATLLLLFLAGHMIGIIVDKVIHKEQENLKSIFTGYKKTFYEDSVQLTKLQKTVAILFLVLFIALSYYFFLYPNNILTY